MLTLFGTMAQPHSAAGHGNLPLQQIVTEDTHHCPRQQEVLLNLGIDGPGRLSAPLDDFRSLDHRLTSIAVFSMTSHGARCGPSAGSAGSRAQAEWRC
jgi:hypothetical protein